MIEERSRCFIDKSSLCSYWFIKKVIWLEQFWTLWNLEPLGRLKIPAFHVSLLYSLYIVPVREYSRLGMKPFVSMQSVEEQYELGKGEQNWDTMS